MTRRFTSLALAFCVFALTYSCARPADNARPLVTSMAVHGPSVISSGAPLALTFSFTMAPDAPPFTENYTVFVHLIDEDGKMIGATDHEPPIPTSAWKPGVKVEYKQSLYAPTTTYVGPATIVVGLYSKTTGERVPVSGQLYEMRAAAVGSLELREHTDPYQIVFQDGWHAPESPRGSGLEWRWSTKSGALSFANPKRNVELVVELDQPNAVFQTAQHVEIRKDGDVLDAFDLEPNRTELRRIPLTQSQLGADDRVELAVVSDKTLVPSRYAALQSTDVRQLGVRVFRAYIEPK